MKECFGYIRVSTAKQGEGVSLEAQREAIENFARRNNIHIAEWYEEKETAAKSGRPVFSAMVKALKAGKASGMIIHRIDRSSRNLKDWALIGELSDSGIDVHFATESLDFRSRGGRLTADIQAVIAADYIRNLRIETLKGINGRLKQGLYPRQAPLGYLDNGSGKPKTFDPVRAPLVKQLFKLYLTGDYSIRALRVEMVRRGLTSRGGHPVSLNTVHTILLNPFYCGIVRNKRTGEQFQGQHEKLISVSDYQHVVGIREGRYVKRTTRHNYLLRRLFWCANCHSILTPERQKSWVYYRCHTKGCSVTSAREDILEEIIQRSLKQHEFSGEDTKEIKRTHDQYLSESKQQELRQTIDLRISQIEQRLDRLSDLLIDEKLDEATHDRKRSAMQMELAKLKEEREERGKNSVTIACNNKFFELRKNLAGLYEKGTPPEKRFLVKNCFSNRVWDGKKVYLEPSDLFKQEENGECVLLGAPISDKIRQFIEIFGKAEPEQGIDETT